MIAGLETALATDGIIWLFIAASVAGLVRGFAGFGAGMILVPTFGVFLQPVTILVAMQVMDGIGSLPLVPRAWRDGEPRRVAPLILGATLAVPVGLYVLTSTDGTIFRWAVAILILGLMIVMALGWRYRERLSAKGTFGVGTISGFLSGFAGLAGPPIVLMYLSGPYRNETTRANIILFFFIITFVGVALLIWRDLMTAERVWLGALLTPVYLIGNVIGARIFDPAKEKLFRGVAYATILTSVLLSLPLWS